MLETAKHSEGGPNDEESERNDVITRDSMAEQLQQLQQRLAKMRWAEEGQCKAPFCEDDDGSGGSNADSQEKPEEEVEGDLATHTTASAASLGSLMMSLAASAAHSVAEKINQSAQQLFRPPGLYEVADRIFICDSPPIGSALAALLPAYIDTTYPNSYLVVNMSERKYNSQRDAALLAATPTAGGTSDATLRMASTGTSSERGSPGRQQQQQQQVSTASPRSSSLPADPEVAASVPCFRTGTVIDAVFRGLPYPPLRLCLSLCVSASRWLRGDKKHILLLQCFRGLGRSVSFAAAFLSWFGMAGNTIEALNLIAAALGVDSSSLPLLPSQRRFLEYFESLMKSPSPCASPPLKQPSQQQQFVTRVLRRVIFCGLPAIEEPPNAFLKTSSRTPEGNLGDETNAGAVSDEQQEQALVFRPVLEVWLQGSLVYSSVLGKQGTHQCACTTETEQEGTKVTLLQQLESPLLCNCRSSCLTTFNPEEGSVRFEVSGVEACGDLLLRLVHVAPEQQQPDSQGEGQQRPEGSNLGSECCCKLQICGRKIPMVRAAFHTGAVDAAGYISFDKQNLDGGPMLAAAFPDDCFLAAFFDPVEGPQGYTGGPSRASKAEFFEKSRSSAEEMLQLVERVQEEGISCRLQRQQEMLHMQQKQEAPQGEPASPTLIQAVLKERTRQYKELAAAQSLSPPQSVSDSQPPQEQQELMVRSLTDTELPECLDADDWDYGAPTPAAAPAVSAASALAAEAPGSNCAAANAQAALLPWQQPNEGEESESDISWGQSEDEAETKTSLSGSSPPVTGTPGFTGQEGSCTGALRSPARSPRDLGPQAQQLNEEIALSLASSSSSSSNKGSPLSQCPVATSEAAATGRIAIDSSSDGDEEEGLPVLGSRTRSVGGGSSASSARSELSGSDSTSEAAAGAAVGASTSTVECYSSDVSSNSDWVALPSRASSPVLLVSPRQLTRDVCTSSGSISSRNSGKSSRSNTPKPKGSLFVLLGQQQQQPRPTVPKNRVQHQLHTTDDTGDEDVPQLKRWTPPTEERA